MAPPVYGRPYPYRDPIPPEKKIQIVEPEPKLRRFLKSQRWLIPTTLSISFWVLAGVSRWLIARSVCPDWNGYFWANFRPFLDGSETLLWILLATSALAAVGLIIVDKLSK